MWGHFSESALDTLRAVLDRHGYRDTARLPAFRTRRVYPLRDLGHAWQGWRGRPPSLSAVSYPGLAQRGLSREAAGLHRCFFQHRSLPPGILTGPEEALLRQEGLLGEEGALVQVAAARGLYLLSSVPRRSPGEFVYLGDDTGMLLDWNADARGSRALDMGTGCGAVAFSLTGRFEQVLGVDVNPNALALAESGARLNRSPAHFQPSDVWEGVEGRFDWIAANLPALPLDPTPNLSFAAAGAGDPTALTRRFFERLEEFLAPGGECRMLTFSPVDDRGDRLWREADERVGRLSLAFRVQDQMALDSPLFKRLRHVAVRVVNDGRGRRSLTGPPWWRRLALPWLPPGNPLQAARL